MLRKRTPGAPLSDAELRQRREAARSRWENYAAGAVLGAGAGAAIAPGLYEQAKKRTLAEARAVRRAYEADIDALQGRAARARATAGTAFQETRKEVGGINSKALGQRNWPVPAYQRLLDRRAAKYRAEMAGAGSFSDAANIVRSLDAIDAERDWLANARPPSVRYRAGSEPVRQTAEWAERRRIGAITPDEEEGVIRRLIGRSARAKFDAGVSDAVANNLPKPDIHDFIHEEGLTDRVYRWDDRRGEMTLRGRVRRVVVRQDEVGRPLGTRAATVARVQGSPNDSTLRRLRSDVLADATRRLTQRKAKISQAFEGLLKPLQDKHIDAFRQVKARGPRWGARGWIGAGMAAGALGGAGLAGAWNRLTAEKVDASELRKDDAPVSGDLSSRIGRVLRSWYESPGGVSRDALIDALEPMRRAVEAQASGQASALARQVPSDADARIIATDFGSRHPYVERAARERQLKLAGMILDEQAAAIRQALVDHALRGDPVDQTARSIRDAVGLAPSQARHVAQYRLELKLLHPNATNRALRDRRFDRTIERALEEKTPLPEEKVDRMVDAYHRRWLAFRAESIARTEALGAAVAGTVASTQAALESMPDMTVIKTWMATKDGKTRDTHRHLDGKSVIGIDTPFVTEAGHQIRWPHDESAPASEVVRCRCTVTFKLVPRDRAAATLMETMS